MNEPITVASLRYVCCLTNSLVPLHKYTTKPLLLHEKKQKNIHFDISKGLIK